MSNTMMYIDGVGRVTVANGMAHLDLIAVVPPSAEGEQAEKRTVSHLVMTLPQFVRMCAEMAGHLQRMEQKGLIQRKAADKPA